jgi:molybdopterin-guanine dinucleotide biosynthesis protein A
MGARLPLGVVLAGGRGSRLGGAKATAMLRGRSLISYPLAVLSSVLDEVVVVCKPGTELPALRGHEVHFERDPLQHPLVGICTALELAGGRPALVCALDLPLVGSELVSRLTRVHAGAIAALASHDGVAQPLLARYSPEALEPLAAADRSAPLRAAVLRCSPALVEVADPVELFNVNTPTDLERAAELLARRSEPD